MNIKKLKKILLIGIILLVPKNTNAKTIAEFEKEVNKYTAELAEKQAKVAKNEAEVAEIKKNIAYLSGNTKIYKSLSTYELLKMCCEIYEVDKQKIENRVKEISKILNMDNFLYNKIENLSTGQTQRVNIARCLVHDPQYYILDEATSGLDIISSQIILDFIKKEKQKGKTIIYSTHYMEEAENICDNVFMINKGKVVKVGTPKQIKRDTNTTNLRDAFFALIGGENDEK